MKKIQSIRGMNDLLPEDSPRWQYLEETVAKLLSGYGYREIRFPILEPTELFKRSIGEVTDIVEKEMYTFDDRNGDSMTLRPEGTAGCVRACEQNSLTHNQIQRLWYQGPMFRYERPQKGRLRQFHQIGVEVFGLEGPDIDAELITMTWRMWQQLGVANVVTLQLNSLGTTESRGRYRNALVEYLQQRKGQLDEDSQRRLLTNPMRIREMTYLFLVIGLAVINALSGKLSYAELLFINGVVWLIVYLMENWLLQSNEADKMIIYEKIENIKPAKYGELLGDLEERTGLKINRAEVGKVDFLKDTAEVRIFFDEDLASR